MGVLQKARDTASAMLDLGLWARLTAAGRSPAAAAQAASGESHRALQATVDPATQRAMDAQGMSWGDPFSPGAPIPPMQPKGTPPLKRIYRVGENIYLQPRANAGVDFTTMESILSRWDLANLCINTRIDQLRLPDWTITARRREDKDKYETELADLRKLFERPDGEVCFDTWIAKLARDWLQYDSACIFRHRNRAGKIIGLEIVDGTSIAMLSDGRGGIPKPPAPAYVQWAWGMPWVWMTTRDLLYEPYWPRAKSRYGYPPIEWLLIQGNTDLRLQMFFLGYFTDGNVPQTWLESPENVTAEQMTALQAKYNALLSGQQNVHHKVQFIPHGTKPYPMKEAALSGWVPFANHIVIKACSSWGIQPAEIGWTENVNKASSASQEDIQFRRSAPSFKYLSERMNRLLAEDLGAPWAKFSFLGIEEEADKLLLAQTDEILVRNAIKSPDQAAIERGLPVDENNPVGRLFVLRTGVAFIQDARASSAALAAQTAAQAGMGLDDAADVADAEDDDAAPAIESASNLRTEGALKPKPVSGPVAPAASGTPGVERGAIVADLRKWRDLAAGRAKLGKAQRPFVSEHIPALLGKAIATELALAESAAEVRAVFAPYVGGGGPPKVRKASTEADKEQQRRQDELAALLLLLLRFEATDVSDYLQQGWSKDLTGAALTAATGRLVDAYHWQDAWGRVAANILPHAAEVATSAANAAAGALSADAAALAQAQQDASAWASGRAAEMVGRTRLPDGTLIDHPNAKWRIDESTRQMIRDEVAAGLREGKTVAEIAEAIRTGAAFSPARAAMIARTEMALARNHGTLAGVRASGGDRVAVTDGEEYDSACQEADGQTWSADYAAAHPLEHPRCVRQFFPTDPNAPIDRQ